MELQEVVELQEEVEQQAWSVVVRMVCEFFIVASKSGTQRIKDSDQSLRSIRQIKCLERLML